MTAMLDFAVIGRGLMGTACARHLAEGGHSVALIGPDEPADTATYRGPFASHHDAGRITRRMAADSDWARLSSRSITAYAELKSRSGIPFYRPCGAMMAAPSIGPGAGFADAFFRVAAEQGIPHDRLEGPCLTTRFPMFSFASGTRAAWDPAGGWIDPRAMRQAEETLAVAGGAALIRDAVIARDGGRLALASGRAVRAAHVVVATGAYAGVDGLLPARPELKVRARTTAFVELSEAEANALDGMPTLIFVPEGQTHDLYVLPPIRYPDGKWRIKIGGEAESPRLTDSAGMTAWFQSDGDATAGETLLLQLQRLMPGLNMQTTSTGACAVAFTATGKPYIARLSDDVTLLAGGNGAGAKCAGELGRLGAMAALGVGLGDEGYVTDFGLVGTACC